MGWEYGHYEKKESQDKEHKAIDVWITYSILKDVNIPIFIELTQMTFLWIKASIWK